MHSILFILMIQFLTVFYTATKIQEEEITRFEVAIASAILRGDTSFLHSVYADDFVFTHGTGLVQNKAEWLQTVIGTFSGSQVITREVSTTSVEIHNDVAISIGKLTIRKLTDSYRLDYVRIYCKSESYWQMISHRTLSWQSF